MEAKGTFIDRNFKVLPNRDFRSMIASLKSSFIVICRIVKGASTTNEVLANLCVNASDRRLTLTCCIQDIAHVEALSLPMSISNVIVMAASDFDYAEVGLVCAAVTKACTRVVSQSRTPVFVVKTENDRALWDATLGRIVQPEFVVDADDTAALERLAARSFRQCTNGTELLRIIHATVLDYRKYRYGTLDLVDLDDNLGTTEELSFQFTGHFASHSLDGLTRVANDYIRRLAPWRDETIQAKDCDIAVLRDLLMCMHVWSELASHLYGRLQSALNKRDMLQVTLRDAIPKKPTTVKKCADCQAAFIPNMVKLFCLRRSVDQALDDTLLRGCFEHTYLFISSLKVLEDELKKELMGKASVDC
eukprot:TRINITY_DN14710_c0_g1_i1.p1 TRINITY_DN14710_c0_g1~~TRINITY_DN14710_c0_g1_i1.p1  ORF type:complete len:362 (+),score=53.59 TRINITY_DN14710_c0_g1_i1:63-1148(+)